MEAGDAIRRLREGVVIPDPPALRGPFRKLGRLVITTIDTIHGLGAFALIALGVLLTKYNTAPKVVHPLVRHQIRLCGARLLPMVLFIAIVLGFVVIGQTISLSKLVGAEGLAGKIMVTVIVRELGPLATAMVVLSWAGTATVIELGTARAEGEVEMLESMGIDPIHYLVIPRVIGMMLGVFSLTIYLILGALVSGYLFAFIAHVPLTPENYIHQIAGALSYPDFILLALKTCGFGLLISMAVCFHGLARPLTLQDVSRASVRAVAQSVVGCLVLDALFILVYLLT